MSDTAQSPEAVALMLLSTICAHEKLLVSDNFNRKTYLDAYAECLQATNSARKIISEEITPSDRELIERYKKQA